MGFWQIVFWGLIVPFAVVMAFGIGVGLGKKEQDKRKRVMEDILDREKRLRETILQECKQDFPHLAQQLADIEERLDLDVANFLCTKPHPALRAAEEVSKIAKEKRVLKEQCKRLQYQLNFLENVFPWLEEFCEVPVQQALEYSNTLEPQNEYETVRQWLSPQEYSSLANAQKFQLALDRWMNRKKTSWDVGIDFERFIGYQLEIRGYNVKYLGATLGLQDMGRDLLASKDGMNLVIQCKRWAEQKIIHEKHICQLFGTVAVLAIKNRKQRYKGVFISTCSLSPVAKSFADYALISYVENCPVNHYPMIKCNVSNTGEKIYHLPFDQQYDRVVISQKRGEFFAWTTKEAEDKGFRRAYRWNPS